MEDDTEMIRLLRPTMIPRSRVDWSSGFYKSDQRSLIRERSPSLRSFTPGSSFPDDASLMLSPSSSPVTTSNSYQSSHLSRGSRNASAQRDYILDLANPERTPTISAENRRQQNHPVSFHCNLCPKRFTRAYNLRSHLRTHTDERPFVCTVCGKAFARQYERKHHERLHAGRRTFVTNPDQFWSDAEDPANLMHDETSQSMASNPAASTLPDDRTSFDPLTLRDKRKEQDKRLRDMQLVQALKLERRATCNARSLIQALKLR